MVRKGIFPKILFSTLTAVLIFAVITTSLISILLKKYMLSSEENKLMQYAQQISSLTVFLLENDSKTAYGLYQRSLDTYAHQLNSAIFVTDATGRVMLSATGSKLGVGDQLESRLVEEAMKGNAKRQWGTLDGNFSEKRLNIALPLLVHGQIGGTLVLSSPMPQIKLLMMDVFRILFLSLLFSLAASMAVAFFISKRISRPIQRAREAAEAFAQGKFDMRITEYPEDDEVGELAVAFNEMACSLNELELNRRAFVANVSHELRSPLTTLSGFVEGILDGTVPPEKQPEYLHIVLEEAKRLIRLVNDLLYMERSDKEELHYDVFDINELIRLALIGFEGRITEKKIEVNAEFARETEVVKANRDDILRVVTNLLDNAVKFTPENGRIFLAVREDPSRVSVQVGNSGEPVPKEVLRHMFDRFYKADLSRGINKNGTGLGLHIVKTILARHGQTIRVSSDGERGTVFTFTLDRQK